MRFCYLPCHHCHERVKDGDKYIEYPDQVFHYNCFLRFAGMAHMIKEGT